MVYLKIPTGKNAHEDTTYIHNIIHGKNSVVHKQFTMIVNDSTSLSDLRWEYGEGKYVVNYE